MKNIDFEQNKVSMAVKCHWQKKVKNLQRQRLTVDGATIVNYCW